MPRRSILSVAERESLLSLPASQDDLIRHYSLSESDLSLVRQRRGASNRLGFAILLGYMHYPGIILGLADEPDAPFDYLRYIGDRYLPMRRYTELLDVLDLRAAPAARPRPIGVWLYYRSNGRPARHGWCGFRAQPIFSEASHLNECPDGAFSQCRCERKKRANSLVASGPCGSVYDPDALPPDQAWPAP